MITELLETINEASTDDDASFVDDRTTPAWRQFELDVVQTVKNLDPAAKVLHNQVVLGIFSQSPRQLDAVATKSVAGAPIDVVIECKQYVRKLGIGKIDEFVGKLMDLGCGHGILYATNGFTEPARRRAEASILPKIVIRDLTDVAKLTVAGPLNSTTLDEVLGQTAVDFSNFIEDAVLGTCQANNCWYGEVQLGTVDGVLVGSCDSCGQLHIQCGCCDELFDIDWSSGSCFSCGAEYHIVSYQGDLDGIEQVSHGPDCDHNVSHHGSGDE